jgi:hypothetical protein
MHVAERITHQWRRTLARNSSNSTLLSHALPKLPYQQSENGTPRLAKHHIAGPSLSNSWLDVYRSRSQDRQNGLDLDKDESASTNAGRMAETPPPDGAHNELHEAFNLMHILCSDPRGKEGTQEFLMLDQMNNLKGKGYTRPANEGMASFNLILTGEHAEIITFVLCKNLLSLLYHVYLQLNKKRRRPWV